MDLGGEPHNGMWRSDWKQVAGNTMVGSAFPHTLRKSLALVLFPQSYRTCPRKELQQVRKESGGDDLELLVRKS
jgi:hypothetical protein